MYETRQQVTERKIRNGKRKQAEKVWIEKMKVWDILKGEKVGYQGEEAADACSYYCPYIPLTVTVVNGPNILFDLETTA